MTRTKVTIEVKEMEVVQASRSTSVKALCP